MFELVNPTTDYAGNLVRINAMIKNLARATGLHPDEVFVDLAEMD